MRWICWRRRERCESGGDATKSEEQIRKEIERITKKSNLETCGMPDYFKVTARLDALAWVLEEGVEGSMDGDDD